MSNENNRSGGGNMPKPPASNEVPAGDPATGEEQPVKIHTGAPPPHSEIAAKERKSGIKVTALMKGFIGGLRRVPGDKFLIPGKKSWGSWMECEDKDLQAELMKANKARIKKIREL